MRYTSRADSEDQIHRRGINANADVQICFQLELEPHGNLALARCEARGNCAKTRVAQIEVWFVHVAIALIPRVRLPIPSRSKIALLTRRPAVGLCPGPPQEPNKDAGFPRGTQNNKKLFPIWGYFRDNYVNGNRGGIKGPGGDQYMFSHAQVDAQGSYRIGKGFEAIVSGLNLNNVPFGFYQGSKQFLIQREYYKPTYTFGLRWSPRSE